MIDPAQGAKSMRALKTVGVPYTQQDIDGAAQELSNVTEQTALIAYLQSLGKAYK
jgi:cytochrome c oxidase cbb3-type subunit 2